MAAITPTFETYQKGGGFVLRWSGTGATNQADTLTSTVVAAPQIQRLNYVSCHYDGSPTQAGITVTIKHDGTAIAALFDTVLDTSSSNAQNYFFNPTHPVFLLPGDSIEVAAPAGGADREVSIVIVTETA